MEVGKVQSKGFFSALDRQIASALPPSPVRLIAPDTPGES